MDVISHQQPSSNIKPIAMIKLTPFFILFCILAGSTPAQAQYFRPTRIFKQGQVDIRTGIGLFPTYSKDASRISVPPVSLSADWMVADPFSLGVSAGYSLYQIEKIWRTDSSIRNYATHTLQVMARAAAHYTRTDNLDVYGGLQVGCQNTMVKSLNQPFGRIEQLHGIRPQRFSLFYGAFLGVRYAASAKLTLWGEFGTGISFAQVGFGVKIL